MTTHIQSTWTWSEPLDDFPYEEVVAAIESHGRKPPPAYAILSPGDALVFNIGVLLFSNADKEKLTRNDIEEFITKEAIPTSIKKQVISIMVRVLQILKVFEGEEE